MKKEGHGRTNVQILRSAALEKALASYVALNGGGHPPRSAVGVNRMVRNLGRHLQRLAFCSFANFFTLGHLIERPSRLHLLNAASLPVVPSRAGDGGASRAN